MHAGHNYRIRGETLFQERVEASVEVIRKLLRHEDATGPTRQQGQTGIADKQ